MYSVIALLVLSGTVRKGVHHPKDGYIRRDRNNSRGSCKELDVLWFYELIFEIQL